MAKTKKPLYRTPPTKKAGRYANLAAHAAAHPNDKQSEVHLANAKWAQYR